MVGQISVFPDVGAAFFGSYRGARNQRLQESAMRAEMAAAQAERQRQAQARDAFARLQGPNQRIERANDSTSFGAGSTPFTQERVTQQGLTPEQRSREEQRLAQADPNAFMAHRQSQAGPEVDLSDIYDVQASRVQANPENMETAVTNAVNVAASRGVQIAPQQAYAEIQGRVGAPEEAELTSSIREYEYAQDQGYQGTYQQWIAARAAAGRAQTTIHSGDSGVRPIRILTDAERQEAGLGAGVWEAYVDSQDNTRVRQIGGGSNGSGGGSGTPTVGGDVLDELTSQVDRRVIDMDTAVGRYVEMSRESGNTEASPEYARLAISHGLNNEAIGIEQANTMARHTFDADRAVMRQLQALDEIYEISADYGPFSSGLASNFAFVRGTPPSRVRSFLENVTSQEIIDQLQAMREYAQSIGERGSGFGQLTQNEIRVMEAMQTLLTDNMPPEQLRSQTEAFARELHFARSERMRAMEQFMPEVYSEFTAIENRFNNFRSPGNEGDETNYDTWERF